MTEYAMGGNVHTEEEAARQMLAERLFSAMERLDPSQVSIAWSDLGRDEKEFYRAAIRALESERDFWSVLLPRRVD